MQVVPQQFHDLAQGDIIPLSWGNRISFTKEWDDSVQFAQYNVSAYDGTDLYAPSEDDPINFWDYYKYDDYTKRLLSMEWTRTLDFPYSVSSAQADFVMNNTDSFFNPNSGSAIEDYILPKRPVRLLAGYAGNNLQQFVGITEKAPLLDDTAKTASFHGTDFLTEIFALSLTDIIAMQNVRTDEVLTAILSQFDIAPSSYVFAKARNVIPFVFFDVDKNAGNAIRELMQAEGGHLWIDENGVIRFETRLPEVESPVILLDDSNTVSLSQSGDIGIINQVKITSDVRTVREFQKIKSNVSDEATTTSTTENAFIIPANGSAVYNMDLDDPCLTVQAPIIGERTDGSWFTATTTTGASVSNVAVTGTVLHTNQYVTFLKNNNSFPVIIDQFELWGQPARIKNTIKYLAKDQDSIDKYELQALGGDEGITNNFFGSYNNCESFAQTIVDAYSDFNPTLEAEIIGDYSLQMGDVVALSARLNDDLYRITSVTTQVYPFNYKIKARRYNQRSWAKYDITVYNDPVDVLAP